MCSLRTRLLLRSAVALASVAAQGPACGDAARLADGSDGDDWPAYRPHLRRAALQPARRDQRRATSARLGLAWSLRPRRPAIRPASPIAVDGMLYCRHGLQHRARGRRRHRQAAVDLRSRGRRGRRAQAADAAGASAASPSGTARSTPAPQDGRLIALDAKTGKPVWSVADHRQGRSAASSPARRACSTARSSSAMAAPTAPRCAATSPPMTPRPASSSGASTPCPAIRPKGFENKAMEMAAKTWTGEWWKFGGGGTVWNAITYDPETDTRPDRHRQRLAVEPEDPQRRRRRQPVPLLDRRARRRDRRVQVALSGQSRRDLGLQRRRWTWSWPISRSTASRARC